MTKQELLHLHALLRQLAADLAAADRLQLDIGAYEALGTTPTAVHLHKDRHQAAVFALTASVVEALPESAVLAEASATSE